MGRELLYRAEMYLKRKGQYISYVAPWNNKANKFYKNNKYNKINRGVFKLARALI